MELGRFKKQVLDELCAEQIALDHEYRDFADWEDDSPPPATDIELYENDFEGDVWNTHFEHATSDQL